MVLYGGGAMLVREVVRRLGLGVTGLLLLGAATLVLDGDDLAVLGAVLEERGPLPGDVYDLERDKGGPHAAIMRYDLNAKTGLGAGG